MLLVFRCVEWMEGAEDLERYSIDVLMTILRTYAECERRRHFFSKTRPPMPKKILSRATKTTTTISPFSSFNVRTSDKFNPGGR